MFGAYNNNDKKQKQRYTTILHFVLNGMVCWNTEKNTLVKQKYFKVQKQLKIHVMKS